MLFFLHNADTIFHFAAEFDEKLFPGLCGVVLDHIKVIEGEFFAFEGDRSVTLAGNLTFHGFDQVETGFIGLDLDCRSLTLYRTSVLVGLSIVIEECIY